MLLKYSDTNCERLITVPTEAESHIQTIIHTTAPGVIFDYVHVDLRDECIEEVICYHRAHRQCSFGGAIAWNMYQAIARVVPEIKPVHQNVTVTELMNYFKLS